MDILCLLLKKKLMEESVIVRGRRIITSGITLVAGLLLLHIALLLLALSLYHYLLSLPVTAVASALISGLIYMLLAALCFLTTAKLFSTHPRNTSHVLQDMLYAFLQGIKG